MSNKTRLLELALSYYSKTKWSYRSVPLSLNISANGCLVFWSKEPEGRKYESVDKAIDDVLKTYRGEYKRLKEMTLSISEVERKEAQIAMGVFHEKYTAGVSSPVLGNISDYDKEIDLLTNDTPRYIRHNIDLCVKNVISDIEHRPACSDDLKNVSLTYWPHKDLFYSLVYKDVPLGYLSITLGSVKFITMDDESISVLDELKQTIHDIKQNAMN